MFFDKNMEKHIGPNRAHVFSAFFFMNHRFSAHPYV